MIMHALLRVHPETMDKSLEKDVRGIPVYWAAYPDGQIKVFPKLADPKSIRFSVETGAEGSRSANALRAALAALDTVEKP